MGPAEGINGNPPGSIFVVVIPIVSVTVLFLFKIRCVGTAWISGLVAGSVWGCGQVRIGVVYSGFGLRHGTGAGNAKGSTVHQQ